MDHPAARSLKFAVKNGGVILSERGPERLLGSSKSDGYPLGGSLGLSSGVVSEESAFFGFQIYDSNF